MRTSSYISAELKRVPSPAGGGITPYVAVSYYTSGAPHDGGGSWTRLDNVGGQNRIIDARGSDEPFSGTVTITLDNSQGTFTSLAATYKGKWLKVDRGLIISGSTRLPSEAFPYYYCTGFRFTSQVVGGRAVDVLRLFAEGAWNRLGRLMAVPDVDTPANGAPYYWNQPTMDATRDNKAADVIFSAICDMAGIFKGTIGSWSDYITSWKPKLTFDYDTTVSGHVGPTGDVACLLLLQPFRVRALARSDGLYLMLPGTSTQWTFKCPTDVNYQPFTGGVKDSNEPYPSKVAVVNGSYGGTYGTSSMGGYNYPLAESWNIGSSNALCAWIAQSIVQLIQEQQDSGTYDVPVFNPLLELYDYVTIIDQRGQTGTSTGRVGGISWQYTPSAGIYSMRVRLGGVWGLPEGVTELTGGRETPKQGSGSSSGGSSSGGSSGGGSGSGSSTYTDRSSALASLSTYVEGIRAGTLIIGETVTGDLSDLGSYAYDELEGLPDSLNDISATEYQYVTYAQAGLDSLGRLKTYVYGPGLVDLSMTGKVAGLYMTKTRMGYWNGSSWNNYFDSSGNGYFRGTIYAANIATGYTLTVNGNIDVITYGTSFAGVRIGTHTISGLQYRGLTVINSSGYTVVQRFMESNGATLGALYVGAGQFYVVGSNGIYIGASSGDINITGGSGRDIKMNVSSGGMIKILGCPPSDPHELGAIYYDPATKILYASQG